MPFTKMERAALVAEWRDSSMTQDEFAATKGISARTLRLWNQQFPAPSPNVEEVRRIVAVAIEQLRAMLDSMAESAPSPSSPLVEQDPRAASLMDPTLPVGPRGFQFDLNYLPGLQCPSR